MPKNLRIVRTSEMRFVRGPGDEGAAAVEDVVDGQVLDGGIEQACQANPVEEDACFDPESINQVDRRIEVVEHYGATGVVGSGTGELYVGGGGTDA